MNQYYIKIIEDVARANDYEEEEENQYEVALIQEFNYDNNVNKIWTFDTDCSSIDIDIHLLKLNSFLPCCDTLHINGYRIFAASRVS